MRTNTSPFRGSYYSHGKQFIENLPIPLPTAPELMAINALVAQMIDTLDAVARARMPHQRDISERQAADLRVQIEAHVTALFGISPADIEIVRAVPVPN